MAIDMDRSIDLDICVDEADAPYLGHSAEFYELSGTPRDCAMPLWDAVELISKATIPAIVDCKHYRAWPYVEEVIRRIGPDRCLVHTFISEFNFSYVRGHDVTCEWTPVEKLKLLKAGFPSVTTTASAKGLPHDLMISERYDELLDTIKKTLVEHQVDTVCLNVPDKTFSDQALAYFLEDNIIAHVMIDEIDTSNLSEMYIGETDKLDSASISACL